MNVFCKAYSCFILCWYLETCIMIMSSLKVRGNLLTSYQADNGCQTGRHQNLITLPQILVQNKWFMILTKAWKHYSIYPSCWWLWEFAKIYLNFSLSNQLKLYVLFKMRKSELPYKNMSFYIYAWNYPISKSITTQRGVKWPMLPVNSTLKIGCPPWRSG
jgi:hypothetical protein